MNDELESRRPGAIPWSFWSFARVAYRIFSDNPFLVVWMLVGTAISFAFSEFLAPAIPTIAGGDQSSGGLLLEELGDYAKSMALILIALFVIGLILEVGVTFNALAAYRGDRVDLREGLAAIERRPLQIVHFVLVWLALLGLAAAAAWAAGQIAPTLGILTAMLGLGVFIAFVFVSFYFVPLLVDTEFDLRDLLRASLRLARATGAEIIMYWIASIVATIFTSLISADGGVLGLVAQVVASLASVLVLTYLAVLRCVIYDNALERFGSTSP